MFQCYNGTAPEYLRELVSKHDHDYNLHSVTSFHFRYFIYKM